MTLQPGMLPEGLALIKAELLHGAITIDEAKEKAQPFLDEMNEKARKIAKKYKRRFRPFTYNNTIR